MGGTSYNGLHGDMFRPVYKGKGFNEFKIKKKLVLTSAPLLLEFYPGFRSIKRLGVLMLLLDGMLVHRRYPPSISSGFPSLLVPTYSWVERGTVRVKYLAQEHNTMTRVRLKPGPLDAESSALTTRPPRLPKGKENCRAWMLERN